VSYIYWNISIFLGHEDDDGSAVASSSECRHDRDGLLLTILIVELWLLWSVLFYSIAWYLNHYYRHKVDSYSCIMLTRKVR